MSEETKTKYFVPECIIMKDDILGPRPTIHFHDLYLSTERLLIQQTCLYDFMIVWKIPMLKDIDPIKELLVPKG